jgi:hypothetical protein
LASPVAASGNFEQHLQGLLELLEPSTAALQEFRSQGHELTFYCGYFFHNEQGGQLEIAPETLARIARLGASLDIRTYWAKDG